VRQARDRFVTRTGLPVGRMRKLAVMSLAVALAAAGSFIKIPSPVGTVALDSWPGYLCALLMGPEGSSVALAGHLASGFTSGFPLGMVLHALIAVEMCLCALAFGWVARRAGVVLGAAVAVVLNGLIAPLALTPWLGRPLAASLLLPLSTAAAVNVSLATAAAKAIVPSLVVRGRSSHEGR